MNINLKPIARPPLPAGWFRDGMIERGPVMDLMALVLSFVAGGLVACLAIFWMLARDAPHIDGDIFEKMRREADEAEQVYGGLLMRDVPSLKIEDRGRAENRNLK